MLMLTSRCLIICAALMLSLPATAAIYKWQDASGRWHYSDTPHSGAAPVDLPPVQVYEPPSTPPPTRTSREKQPEPTAALSYSRVEIISPGPEATLREASGDIGVVVSLEPSLRPGHQIRLLLDGKPVAGPASTTAFTLNHIDRGEHKISAEVLDANGQVITRSAPQTFYLHRPSLLNRPAQ